ncbi:M48 family metallopeptidase [Hyphobacterium marinum]|uniref:SprT family zinc-dependent metalloprotease n=1 Tax=Hyphobacterium marinum TaxID=3116574 RepID=A0ABU7LWZ3_9PROT|nr:SprT family zinc-dependent metalloprotease [Hyphobacterium sp. Y6023]MEE2566084.1 SprT family zinc-dependent metalloprotease [Hyphobacterium sp. Y6023]
MIWTARSRPVSPAVETRRIDLCGRPVSFTLKRSARRRTIAFQVSETGLTVFAPIRASLDRIERAITGRQDWILAKLDEWADRPRAPVVRFETGDRLMFRGQELALKVQDLTKGVRTKIAHDADRLIVSVDPEAEGSLRTAAVRGAVTRWYRRAAETHLSPRVHVHAETLGKRVRKVMVRDQKRRWGSCDSEGVIRLNWRLIMMDDALSDYVCAHEAAHLVEANHSPAYWAVVERLVPDWKARRKALNEAGRSLPVF